MKKVAVPHNNFGAFPLKTRLLVALLVIVALSDGFAGPQRFQNEGVGDDWWMERAASFLPRFGFTLLSTNPISLDRGNREMVSGLDAPTAGSFYWDTSNTAGLQAGSGTWSTAVINWNTSPTGANTRVVWANPSDAFFETSGTSTVTVSGTVQASSVTFNGTGYTISSGTLTLTGAGGNITANQNATINSSIGGSVGLTKLGLATLTVNASGTIYSGNTTIQAGTLATNVGDFFGPSNSTIFINAGTLRYDATYTGASNLIQVGSATSAIDVSGANSYTPGAISGSGSLTKNGTGLLSLNFVNTFPGGFTANAGTTDLNINNALGSVSSVTVASGALVESPGNGTTNVINDSASVTLNGTLDVSGGTETVGSLAGTSTGSLVTGDFGATAGSFTVGNSSSTTFAGIISGTRASAGAIFTKQGTGTLTLSGANTYSTGGTTIAANGGTLEIANNSSTTAGRIASTGRITVNSGGTLLLSGAGSADRINNTAPVTLAGGTFRLGGSVSEGTTAAAGIGVGALTLTSSSIIDLTGTNPSLHFAASNTQTWTGTLSIYNWNGTPVTGNGPEQIAFGSNTSALTGAQLNQVSFYSDSGTTFLGTAIFAPDGDGELVPVPEPSTWLAAALALGVVGFTQRRRLRGIVRVSRRGQSGVALI